MMRTRRTTNKILTKVRAVPARAPRPKRGASRATSRKIRIRLIICVASLLEVHLSYRIFPFRITLSECYLKRRLVGEPDLPLRGKRCGIRRRENPQFFKTT